jgi:L-fuculose-phosphate aldolase
MNIKNSVKSTSLDPRASLIELMLELERIGLNRGTSGNCSIRSQQGFFVTPSGILNADLTPKSIVEMNLEGDVLSAGNPSSEWQFHKDILKKDSRINVVIHAHSDHATALSCFREDIPAFHYMIAAAGGDSIICAPYALFGSQDLSDNVTEALRGRNACLMSNHGMIVVGETLSKALTLSIEVETLCKHYLLARQMGEPILLSKTEMREVLEKFKNYGGRKDDPS